MLSLGEPRLYPEVVRVLSAKEIESWDNDGNQRTAHTAVDRVRLALKWIMVQCNCYDSLPVMWLRSGTNGSWIFQCKGRADLLLPESQAFTFAWGNRLPLSGLERVARDR